jgi:hypothetical protein
MKIQILKLLLDKLVKAPNDQYTAIKHLSDLILHFFEEFIKNRQNFSYCFDNYVLNYYIKNLFINTAENTDVCKIKEYILENYRDIVTKSGIIKAHLYKQDLAQKEAENPLVRPNVVNYIQTNIFQPEILRKRSVDSGNGESGFGTSQLYSVKKFKGRQKLFRMGEKLMGYLYNN